MNRRHVTPAIPPTGVQVILTDGSVHDVRVAQVPGARNDWRIVDPPPGRVMEIRVAHLPPNACVRVAALPAS